MAFLKVLAASGCGQIFSIGTRKVVTLGRESTCDLVLNKQSLSRQHAQIIAVGDGYAIEDNGSTNGTFLNGHRLRTRTLLNDGDQILVHDVPILYSSARPPDSTMQMPLTTPSSAPVEYNGGGGNDSQLSDEIPQRFSATDRLNSLMQIVRHLGSSLDTESILPRTLDLLFNMFPYLSVGEIHIANGQQMLVPVAMKHGRESDSRDLTIKSNAETLIRKVYETGHSRIEHSEGGDDASVLDSQFLSTLCSPILGAGDYVMGVIMVQCEESARPFDEEDLELISTVAVLTAQALGYSRAHQLALRIEKNERELETARTIQLATLPTEPPQVTGYRFANCYMAAGQVGGDCYFYELLGDGRVVFGLADASGKGLSAALHITRFVGELRLRLATAPSFKQALSQINRVMCQGEPANFVTACICILDPVRHTLSIGNAGHMPPIRIRQTEPRIEKLKVPQGSFPFGIEADNPFHPYVVPIAPGDKVFFYTDGVSEALNAAGEMYSPRRLMQVLEGGVRPLQQDIDVIVQDVRTFRGRASVSDDLCVVAFQRDA